MEVAIDYYLVGRLKTSHVSHFGAVQLKPRRTYLTLCTSEHPLTCSLKTKNFRLRYTLSAGEIKEIVHPFGVPVGAELALTVEHATGYDFSGVMASHQPERPRTGPKAALSFRLQQKPTHCSISKCTAG